MSEDDVNYDSDSMRMSQKSLDRDIKNIIKAQNEIERRQFNVQDIVNSKKVNETLLINVEEMFELEFDIKMKA